MSQLIISADQSITVVVTKEQPAVESQRGLKPCLAPDQLCDLLLDFSEPWFAHL